MEFLFDDDIIDRRDGVRRVLGDVRKDGRSIISPEMPWESDSLGRASVIFDREEGIFKIWYRTVAMETAVPDVGGSVPPEGGESSYLCYAESDDGLNWERRSLGIHEFRGSSDNNIVMELPPDIDTPFFNILKDPDDSDEGRRYKAIGFDDSVTSSLRDRADGERGVCVSYSPDGFNWEEPELVMSTDDLTDCDCVLGQRDPTTGRWVAFFRPRTHPKRRFIAYSESLNFDHWTYPRMLLTPEGEDDRWIEFYGMTAAVVGRWRVGCLWVMHNNPEHSPMTNELVYSRDGLNYRRAMPRVQFLPLGPDGSADSRMIMPIALIERENGCLLYYRGTNQEHGSDRSGDGIGGVEMPRGRVDGDERRSILSVARIEGRNFCGLRAEFDGVVETGFLCNYGDGGVEAHADAGNDGWIRAEILDQYGRVIPGWDRYHCEVRYSRGRVRFCWGQEELVGINGQTSDEGGKVGHVVKLRFYLHKATLYGFQVGKEGSMPPYR